MAFERPTLQQLVDRIRGDIKSSLQITAILRRSFLAAFARALAGASHSMHGHLVFISKQIFPDQAEAEFLVRWASIFNVQRNPATFTTLTIDVTATAAATVPAGSVYQRSDGVQYEVDDDIVATGAGTFQGTITCTETGASGNLDAGEGIELTSPIAGIETTAEVSAIAVEGEDEEDDESLRERLVDRLQNPPSGGTINDYKQWMLAVTGVTRAWVTPGLLGEGTVVCYFVEDGDDPIIPDAAKIAEVQAKVDEERPVTADAYVVAPVARVLDLTILLNPNTVAVQTAVTAEIQDLIYREAQVAGSYKEVGEQYDGVIAISKLNEAISIAAGEEDHAITSHDSDIVPITGELVILGDITFGTLG